MTADGPRWRLVRAGTDAVPARIRRLFATRAPRPPGRSGRRWLVVATAAVVVGLLGWLLWATPVLGVREVRVTGTGILTQEQVRAAAAVPDRTPLLRVDGDEVAARVAGLPPVARVRIGRDWPRTLVIEVVERTPVAAVPAEGGFRLVDAEGVVFHVVPEAPAELPLVVLAEPGPDDPATRSALTVLAALTPRLRADLDTLTVAGPADIELSLRSGPRVLWGDETDSDEKARVATALLDLDGLPDSDEPTIDVSAPEVVAVR
jgi:cell division protein FtsQ